MSETQPSVELDPIALDEYVEDQVPADEPDSSDSSDPSGSAPEA